MSDVEPSVPPLWRRVADFPLMALVLALLLYAAATGLGHLVGELVPPLGQPWGTAVHMMVMLAFILPIYKLAIAHLGEQPHDDLQAAMALPGLAKGIAAGALLFCAVAGLAATVGAYQITGYGEAPDLLVPLITTAVMPAFTEELLF